MPREYFQSYHSYRKSIEPLSHEERGRLWTALLLYSETGELPELDGNERFVFPTIQAQIDRDNEKYEQKCEKNRQNGSFGGPARGRTPANGSERPPNAPQGKGEGKGKGEGEEKREGEKKSATRFTPPTVDEVAAYCKERNNGIDPQHFVDFYTANGWKVGKNAMKDWKAAVRTWERRNAEKHGGDKRASKNSPTGGDNASWGITPTEL